MFKIVLNDGKKLPDDKILYIVSKNGIYIKKKVGIVESLTKIKGISFLEDAKPYAKLDIPKIPARTFGKIMTFFRKIYEVHNSECNAILYYNEEKKKFKTIIPPQEVTSSSVKYIRLPSMEGYVRLSTIHSHPGFSAFHSGTDTGDEKDSDGLHITVGNIKNPVFDIVASIVVSGSRFKVEPQDYIEGIQKVQIHTEPKFITIRTSFYGGIEKEDDFPLWEEAESEEGYKFTTWRKKFERYNPKWFGVVTKHLEPVTTFVWKGENDYLGFPTYGGTTIKDILPEPKDVKTKEKEEYKPKEFNPCETCPFRYVKETAKLTEESHGI